MTSGSKYITGFLALLVVAAVVAMLVVNIQKEQLSAQQILTLNQQLEKSREEVRHLGVAADQMAKTHTEEINTARATYQETFDKLTATSTELKVVQQKQEELQKQGSDTSLAKQAVENELKAVKIKLAETEKNLTTEKAMRGRTEKFFEEATRRKEQLEKQYAEIQDQLSKANEEISKLNDALTRALTPSVPDPSSKTPAKSQ